MSSRPKYTLIDLHLQPKKVHYAAQKPGGVDIVNQQGALLYTFVVLQGEEPTQSPWYPV